MGTNMEKFNLSGIFVLLLLVMPMLVTAAEPAAGGNSAPGGSNAVTSAAVKNSASRGSLDSEIRSLRQDILEMNSELLSAEKDFLFPASTQYTVFVSMDTARQFDLRSVELRLNNRVVAHHLYTERELYALQRGGMHRLYVGSLAPGNHELVAYFLGNDENQRDYRRGISRKFDKTEKPQFTELKVTNIRSRKLPEFDINFWE